MLVGDLTYGAEILERVRFRASATGAVSSRPRTRSLLSEEDAGPGRPAGARSDRCPTLARELIEEATTEAFENTVTIGRPVAEVFAFLADFENVPMWNHAIEETRKTSPGPVGVGTIYRQTRSKPRRAEEAFEVTVFEPASRLGVKGQIGPFRATVGYLLEPAGAATRLVNVVELKPSSGVLRLFAPLATTRVKAAVGENLATLKKILEGGGRRGDF